ncbi:MAG: hypothetical protein DWQ04_08515 [Chloroflexi bacterium]|nr:MAG: hypothetical protein DWQ04_08515 [Chloroflexota bacterium]
MNDKVTTAVFNILNNPTNQPPGNEIARQLHNNVLAALRQNPEQRVIADRYEQYPTETAALLKLELVKLLNVQPELVETLQALVVRYETAVSNTPPSTEATVTGSGTIVQGDSNTVIGAGATYIENSTVNLPQHEANAEDILGARPDLQQLRIQITEYFGLNDLQDLCWELGILYEDLGSNGLSAKVRELLGFCWRNGRISDLLDYCRKARPHLKWPSV